MRIVLSGGGTGGHIYPAISIAEHCLKEQPDTELLYIGSTRGLEKDIIPAHHIRFESIEITGFRRKLSLDNVKTIVRFMKGVTRSKQILQSFKPDIVVGTGGYVCGPVLYAAAKLGIPTLIHEQNIIPGLTNTFLSRYVDSIAVSLQGSEQNFPKAKHVIYTGNPRATAVSQADRTKGWKSLGLEEGRKIVIVVGGSGGAKAINDAMIEMVGELERLPDTQFIYVTGKAYYEATSNSIDNLTDCPTNLQVIPYIDNMPEVLAATSLIVNRSGASFLAEITSLGIPSILIPSPNVTNNHQEKNARWLEGEGAAEVILEQNLDGSLLFNTIERIMNDPVRAEHLSNNAKKMGQPDAAERIIQEMHRIIKNEN